ncbi:MAG: zinc ribbon domain-containing protein [Solirubrobacterales bacterium]|nr:zinc ribbon domain-containing protein [Solirubrobacterales bacterium]
MPLYAFVCGRCGPFELQRPMTSDGTAARCPSCAREARRVYTPPGLALLNTPVRRALTLEEKSAHEPELVAEKRGRRRPHRHSPSPPWVLSH